MKTLSLQYTSGLHCPISEEGHLKLHGQQQHGLEYDLPDGQSHPVPSVILPHQACEVLSDTVMRCGSPSLKYDDERGVQKQNYWTLSSREHGLLGVAVSTFQLSMIARVVDTAKFREANLAAYPLFHNYGVIE